MSVAKHYPYAGEKGRLRLGLTPIKISEWIQYEDDFNVRIKEKKRLICNDRARVLDATKESLPAQQELLSLIIDHLRKYKSDIFVFDEGSILSKKDNNKYKMGAFKERPLELISYLVPDDICVLEPYGDDYRLVAASVCAPTWWSLSEKMGKPLIHIHSPVANLEEKIGRMIRHFLKNLKYGDCYQRSNWFFQNTQDLCVFPKCINIHEDFADITSDNIEKKLFLRSERQTFRKLLNTGAVVFGIKIYTSPISIIKSEPAIGEDLLISIKEMSEKQKEALFINLVEDSLIDYIQKVI